MWAAVAGEGEWIGTELPLHSGWGDRYRAALEADASTWFVAEEAEQVVGGIFVHAEHGVAHIGMAIIEGHRAANWPRPAGCCSRLGTWGTRMHKVSLEVWPHNARARRLYRRAGFADEGRLVRHYRRRSGALWDAIIMSLILDRHAPGRS